jgi:hypothetical protein
MGRPKGSKNKRTVGIPAELSAACGHRDPAEVLGEIYSMPHKILQKRMRSAAGSRAVMAAIQAASAAMPYVHSKMPVKVEVSDDQLPTLAIITNANAQQNQKLIDAAMEGVRLAAVRQNAQTIEVKGETDDKPSD